MCRWCALLLISCGHNQLQGLTADAEGEAESEGEDSAKGFTEFPDIPFAVPTEDDFAENPRLGIVTSRRYLIVLLRNDASVGDLNDVVALSGATLSGTIPGTGIVQLQYPEDITWDEFLAALDALSSHSAVEGVAEDILLDLANVPPEPKRPTAWTWGSPGGGNWGHEHIHAPQVWSLATHIQRAGHPHVQVAIIDDFARHFDLNGVLTVDRYSDGTTDDTKDPWYRAEFSHGTFIAGIIGARWGNREYIDGLASLPIDGAPAYAVQIKGWEFQDSVSLEGGFARLINTVGTILNNAVRKVASAIPPPRLVNLSLGFNWTTAVTVYGCDPRGIMEGSTCDGAAVRGHVEILGLVFGETVRRINEIGPVLFVTSAGNYSASDLLGPSFESTWNFMNHAALVVPSVRDDIIVAEALALDEKSGIVSRAYFSDINGGGVFAPGHQVMSTSDGHVSTGSGTSYAAPYVVGAAAFLLWLEPSLTNSELRRLLTEEPYASHQDGGGSTTSTRLNLLGAALGVDDVLRERGEEPHVLKWFCDFDDGSQDGFRRVDLDNPETQYTEDAQGDGQVDMRDFRRLRDTFLLMSGQTLDGTADNTKRDLNYDGVIKEPASEVYPRTNLDEDHTMTAADVDVFERAYTEDSSAWTAEDLSGLLHSADLWLSPGDVMAELGEATCIEVDVLGDTPEGDTVPDNLTPLSDILICPEDIAATGKIVVTTPLRNNVHVRWQAIADDTEHEQTIGDLTPGQDKVVVLDEGCQRQGCNIDGQFCWSLCQCVLASRCPAGTQATGGCPCCRTIYEGPPPLCVRCEEEEDVFPSYCPD